MLLSGVPQCFSIVDPRRLRGQDEPEHGRLALHSLQHYCENHMIFFLALASQHQFAADWMLKDGEILLCRIKSAVIIEKDNNSSSCKIFFRFD